MIQDARLQFAEDTIVAHMAGLMPPDFHQQRKSTQRRTCRPAYDFLDAHVHRYEERRPTSSPSSSIDSRNVVSILVSLTRAQSEKQAPTCMTTEAENDGTEQRVTPPVGTSTSTGSHINSPQSN